MAGTDTPLRPNPRRVIAGKLNQLKCKGLTPAGRARLRQAALAHRPWTFSTGPRTPEGKARSARNGRGRRPNLHRGEARDLVGPVAELAGQMAALRRELLGGPGRPPPRPGPLPQIPGYSATAPGLAENAAG
jgi:hypothetical protein